MSDWDLLLFPTCLQPFEITDRAIEPSLDRRLIAKQIHVGRVESPRRRPVNIQGVRVYDTVESVKIGFPSHSAAQPPCAENQALNERMLKGADGSAVLKHRIPEICEVFSTFSGYDDCLSSESVFERIHLRALSPFVGFWTRA
jgi:hypothetical protein